MKKLSEKIPSVLWIPIFIGGIALFIGLLLGGFYALGYVEGFGSILILMLGVFGFRAGNNSPDIKGGGFEVALGISFFALMGMALDQPGNFIYNEPLEWIFCPPESDLVRETIQRGISGGGVSLSQNFECAAQNGGKILRRIAFWELLIVRFLEYIVLGYILLGLNRLYARLKKPSKTEKA